MKYELRMLEFAFLYPRFRNNESNSELRMPFLYPRFRNNESKNRADGA